MLKKSIQLTTQGIPGCPSNEIKRYPKLTPKVPRKLVSVNMHLEKIIGVPQIENLINGC